MFDFGKTEFMQSYYKDKADEMYALIKETGFWCELRSLEPDDLVDGKKSFFKRKKNVPKRHGAEDKIYQIMVKKKEYEDIVEALKKNAAKSV